MQIFYLQTICMLLLRFSHSIFENTTINDELIDKKADG